MLDSSESELKAVHTSRMKTKYS